MKLLRFGLIAGFFMPGVAFAGTAADIAPLSISVFGFYGTPVQPLSLGQSNYDGLGFDFLAEYQPSHYASVGLGYETATFYGNQAFTAGSLNLEGRFFPFAGLKQPYDPYLSGEAGINLGPGSSSQWGGAYALKAGLGTKVEFIGPMSLDFAVESHWMGDSPNFFQYVDARFGIDYALPLQGQPNPTPTAVASPAVSPPPTATPTPMVPLEIGTPASTPKTASPTPAESEVMPANTPTSAPGGKEPAHSLMKKYYLMGIKALKAHKYVTALADLKKAVKYKEKVAYYYYAEAYATIGVIYEFHSKAKNHLSLALANYKMASKIDPDTLTVKKYYKKLKAQLAKPVHAAKLPKSAQVSAAPQISEPAANSVPAAQPAALAPTAVPSAASNPAPAAAPAATPNNNTIPIDLGNGK